MDAFPSEFEHVAESVKDIAGLVASLGADLALLKTLPKNANDKNQIYVASDFGVLFDLFDLTLAERGATSSASVADPRSRIREASFTNFSWKKRNGSLVAVKRLKAIIYPQYPEARLSGLQTIENTMPQSLSVGYTKANPNDSRLLVLARLPRGKCVGIVYIALSPSLERELGQLPAFERARSCKRLIVEQGNSAKLEARLTAVLGTSVRGCRLDAFGRSLPFSGTQVCGYTLEHELGIIPNSGMDGDLYGIELKTHTQLKITLFTPEPDGGHYFRDFPGFMRKYGYKDIEGDLRLTGIHRAGVVCSKSGLTLRVREHHFVDGKLTWFAYDPDTPLTPKMDTVDVALIGMEGEVAASWSLERLMNCWGAKHNEVVYIQASKQNNPNPVEVALGHEHIVSFERTVMWCRETSAERLLSALSDGTIFLDPAPKLHATTPSKNKRRAQWRVNDITKAAKILYSSAVFKTIGAPTSPIELDRIVPIVVEVQTQRELFEPQS